MTRPSSRGKQIMSLKACRLSDCQLSRLHLVDSPFAFAEASLSHSDKSTACQVIREHPLWLACFEVSSAGLGQPTKQEL